MMRAFFRAAGVVVSLLVVFCSARAGAAAPAPGDGAAAVQPAAPNAPPEPPGMESMFNGKDLTGWDGNPALWSVRDGVIRGETTKENPTKGNTFLIWQGEELTDFELRLSFRVSTANNSGIQYRSRHLPFKDTDANRWVVGGYQAEVRNQPGQAGFVYDEKGKRGRMCLVGEKVTWTPEGKKLEGTVGDKAAIAASFRKDDWNDYIIIAEGNHIRHYLNGVQTIDFTDADEAHQRLSGIIALQLHGGAPMWAEFKDLRVKRYPPAKAQ